MKERPILFSAPMVRAILDGSKTQTRRICKPAEAHALSYVAGIQDPSYIGQRPLEITSFSWFGDEEGDVQFRCPYGKPGDRLWVRETWSLDMLGAYGTSKGYDSTYEVAYRADDAEREIRVLPGEPDPYVKMYDSQRGDWRPSIHLPRWASRIQLEITGVRVERLMNLSEVDALAEGITAVRTPAWDAVHFPEWLRQFDDACAAGEKPPIGPLPSQAFGKLWEEINGSGSWAKNPWVWVAEFKRVTL